jgi:hypothetical protein
VSGHVTSQRLNDSVSDAAGLMWASRPGKALESAQTNHPAWREAMGLCAADVGTTAIVLNGDRASKRMIDTTHNPRWHKGVPIEMHRQFGTSND